MTLLVQQLLLLLVLPPTPPTTLLARAQAQASSSSSTEKSSADLLLDSKSFLAAGQKNEAIHALDQAIQRDPQNYLSIFRRAGASFVR